ncbi:MAG: hypothetical protein H7A37_10265 [Chlamydiales bacterium]|nr:hypothetical protein [Chlamydiia bacterium]MCP5508661.1 hypothetical protein [Chlamydiales bacterium]
MSNTTIYILTAVVIVAIFLLFGLQLKPLVMQGTHEYVALNDVRGMAVKYEGKLYTLNLKQQAEAIDLLNNVQPVQGRAFTAQQRNAVDIQEIIIYRFAPKPDISISPIAYVDDSLVFSAPLWQQMQYLMEQSHGTLKALLSKTHAQAN